MRNVFLLIGCCIVLHVNAQFTHIDILYRDSFPAHVRSVVLQGYLVSHGHDGDTILSPMSWRYTEYDKSGRCIVYESRFSDGDFISDSTFFYPAMKTEVLKMKDRFSSAIITKAYNADGTINSIFFDNEKEDVVQEFKYNRRGRLIRLTETYAGQVKVIEYLYTKKGVLVKKSTSYGLVGEKQLHLNEAETYSYDSTGHVDMKLLSYFTGDGSLRRTDTSWYRYNEHGDLTGQVDVQQGGSMQSFLVNVYDSLGRLIEQERVLKLEGEPDYATTMLITYDKSGYCTSFYESSEESGGIVTWETTYDAQGLPLTCAYSNDAEVMFYRWTYVYW
jgi:hypothetical protein